MRAACFVTFVLVSAVSGGARAQTYGANPTPANAAGPPSGPTAAAGPSSPANDSGYQPTPPVESANTHPQPTEYRVWRLVDPTEAEWHSPDPNRPRGWFRMDTDARSTNFYVGGSFRLADGVALAPFAHLSGPVAEPNVGLTWQSGGLWVMPAIGTSIDFSTTRAVSLDPQVFVALDAKVLYLEGWAQYFLASIYHPSATDVFAARMMALVSLNSTIGVGAEWDPTVATHNAPPSSLVSSIVGARTNLRIGDHDTAALFVGYQTASLARGPFDGVAGRFEYVHQW